MPGGIEIYFLMQLLCSALCKLSFVERYKNICIIYVAAVFVYKPTQFQRCKNNAQLANETFSMNVKALAERFVK